MAGGVVLMVGFAFVMALTVAMKSPQPVPLFRKIRGIFGAMFWIIPAIGLIAFISTRSGFQNTAPPIPQVQVSVPMNQVIVPGHAPKDSEVKSKSRRDIKVTVNGQKIFEVSHGKSEPDSVSKQATVVAPDQSAVAIPSGGASVQQAEKSASTDTPVPPVAAQPVDVAEAPNQPEAPALPENPALAESPNPADTPQLVVPPKEVVRIEDEVRTAPRASASSEAGSVPQQVKTQLNRWIQGEQSGSMVRLVARGETDSRPNWSIPDALPSLDNSSPVFQSGRYTTANEALDDVTQKALVFIRRKYQTELNEAISISPALVNQHGVKDLVLEKYQKSIELSDGRTVLTPMYIAHLQLALGESLRNAVYADWKSQMVNRRLVSLSGGMALLTVLLGTASTYLRLNHATGGQYRTRLRMAAAAVVAAVGMAAAMIA